MLNEISTLNSAKLRVSQQLYSKFIAFKGYLKTGIFDEFTTVTFLWPTLEDYLIKML